MDHIDPMTVEEAEALDALDVTTSLAVNRKKGHSRDHTDGLTYYRVIGPQPIAFTNGRGTLKRGRRWAAPADIPEV